MIAQQRHQIRRTNHSSTKFQSASSTQTGSKTGPPTRGVNLRTKSSQQKGRSLRSYQTMAPSGGRGERKQYSTKAPKGKLRIIPVGGCEEVGRNMTIYEYEGDIVIIDMGLQFPEENMPGIDFIIPNIKYLEGREKDILGVVFTTVTWIILVLPPSCLRS